MKPPKTLDIAFIRHADGTTWIAFDDDGESATIPKTTAGWEPLGADLAAFRAVEAGLLAPGGKTKVVDVGFGKGPRSVTKRRRRSR